MPDLRPGPRADRAPASRSHVSAAHPRIAAAAARVFRFGRGGTALRGAVVPRARTRPGQYRVGGCARAHSVHARDRARRHSRRALGRAHPAPRALVRRSGDHGRAERRPSRVGPARGRARHRRVARAALRATVCADGLAPRARARGDARADHRDGHHARPGCAHARTAGNYAGARHAVRRQYLRRLPCAAARRVLPDRRNRPERDGRGRRGPGPRRGRARLAAEFPFRAPCPSDGETGPLTRPPARRRRTLRRSRARARGDLVPIAPPACAGHRHDLCPDAHAAARGDRSGRRARAAARAASDCVGRRGLRPRGRSRLRPGAPRELRASGLDPLRDTADAACGRAVGRALHASRRGTAGGLGQPPGTDRPARFCEHAGRRLRLRACRARSAAAPRDRVEPALARRGLRAAGSALHRATGAVETRPACGTCRPGAPVLSRRTHAVAP